MQKWNICSYIIICVEYEIVFNDSPGRITQTPYRSAQRVVYILCISLLAINVIQSWRFFFFYFLELNRLFRTWSWIFYFSYLMLWQYECLIENRNILFYHSCTFLEVFQKQNLENLHDIKGYRWNLTTMYNNFNNPTFRRNYCILLHCIIYYVCCICFWILFALSSSRVAFVFLKF